MKKGTRRGARKVRYAVVGLGHISQVAALPAFAHARRNSVLAALVSDDERKMRTLGRRYRVPLRSSYADADALFASGEVDAVYVALPNSLHAEWTLRAARHGLHVLCEKPLAVTTKDCEKMIRACGNAGVKLMTAYRLHFERATLEAAKIARRGRLGELKFFGSTFSMQVNRGNIRLDFELGGGPLYDIGIYCINGVRSLFAAEPTHVWASATNSADPRFREVPETVTAVLKFPGDRVGTFTCSFGAADSSAYDIVGTRGSLRMEPAYEYAEGLAFELRIGERKRRRKFAKSDQFAPEFLYFSDCILSDREPEPSGEEGMIDVRIIEALRESMQSGRSVETGLRQRERRPTLRQEIRRPGVRKPSTVNAQQPHS
ncbi:MAG TPA: Gfo/Idh/MocA family oxidoreductase [Steroidobacteraceae bacterium]|nr:Gfo/Idh/MocA family oxidoreductase [Steroidobacteraceae bacterium]